MRLKKYIELEKNIEDKIVMLAAQRGTQGFTSDVIIEYILKPLRELNQYELDRIQQGKARAKDQEIKRLIRARDFLNPYKEN